MVETRGFCGVFRTKIDEGIYSFDVIVVSEYLSDIHSSLVGYCIVNTKKDRFSLRLSVAVDLSCEEMKKIGRNILRDAKNMENVIKP